MTTDSAARGHRVAIEATPARRRVRHLAATIAVSALALTFGAPAGAEDGPGRQHPRAGEHGSPHGRGHRFGADARMDEFALRPAWPLLHAHVAAMIGAEPLHRAGIDGTGVDVALVDTGVAPVPGLDTPGSVLVGPDLSFDPQGADVAPGLDGYGHGTHLASLIAGRDTGVTRGVAPGARILDMKVGAANGAVDVSQVIAAINWVDQHRDDPGMDVRVINLSYGTDGVQPYQIDPLAHAVETAWRHGIVVVVAAGNTGGALTNPAIDPYVLTVGAADMGEPDISWDDRTADFSAVGTPERRVDVLAPGVSLVGARVPGSVVDQEHPAARVADTGFRGSGTSQAAAVVSGAVALLLQHRPDLTPDQVKELLTENGRDLKASPDSSQGGGLIDVERSAAKKPNDRPQRHPVSTGLGRLDAARGSSRVGDGELVLAGEVDVNSGSWDAPTWAAATTAGTTWDGGTWNGNVWTGDGWSEGGEDDLAGRTWRGRTWRGATWTGRTWRGEAWSGRTWRSDIWTGRTWRSVS